MAHEMIHGGGSDYNTGNRWFDKTMQVRPFICLFLMYDIIDIFILIDNYLQ